MATVRGERMAGATGARGARPGAASPSRARGTPRPDAGAPDFATWACFLLIAVTGVRIHEFTFLAAVPNLAVIAAGITLLAALSTRGLQALHVADNPASRWMLFLVFYAGLSIAWSVWGLLSLVTFLGAILAAWVVFLAVLAAIDSWRRQRAVLVMAVVAVLVTSVVYIAHAGSQRSSLGGMYDPNDIAVLFASAVPLLALLRPPGARFRYPVILAAYLVLAAGIVASQSRGGLLALLVGTFLLGRALAAANRRRVIATVLVLALLVGGLAGALALGPQEARERFATMFEVSTDYNLTDERGRIAIWTRGLASIVDYPMGTGVGTSTVADGLQGGRYQAPHNSLLQVGIELGLPGLAAFLGLLFVAWRTARDLTATLPDGTTERMQAAAVTGAIVTFLAGAFFLTLAWMAWLYFLVAVLVAPVVGAARPSPAPAPPPARARRGVPGARHG